MSRRLPPLAHSPRLALGMIVVLGGVLRFGTLGAKSYWADEGLTILEMRGSFSHMWSLVGPVEDTPPLYFVLQWAWSQAFGLSEVGVRSLSALLGTLTVPLIYRAGRRLLGERGALVAATLAAVNPLLLWYSQEARAYALLVFLGALSLLFFLQALQTGRTRSLALWAAACVLMFYTHYFALPLVAVEGAWLLAQHRTRWNSAAALACTAACCVPLPLLLSATHGDLHFVERMPLLPRLLLTPVTLLIGFEAPAAGVFALLAVGLVAVSLAVLIERGSAQEHRGALVAASAAVVISGFPIALGLLAYDLLLSRYVVLAVIPLVILLGAALGATRAGRLGLALAGGLCAMSLVIDGLTAWTPKYGTEDWRAVAASLRRDDVDKVILLFPKGGPETLSGEALAAYLQPSRRLTRAARVRTREVDVVTVTHRISGRSGLAAPRDPTRAGVLSGAGFRLIDAERHRTYAVARYRADSVRRVPAAALAAGAILPGYRAALSYSPAGRP